MFGSYIMFHYVRGVPFEFNSGAFDNLNMWEQIDNGAQYTPTKKFLLSVPIMLFLLSTHYTHYDLAYFIINFLAVLAVIIPKLPFVRIRVDCSLHITWRVEFKANGSTEPPDARWALLRYSGGIKCMRIVWAFSVNSLLGRGGISIERHEW
jgi:hypothetical protein